MSPKVEIDPEPAGVAVGVHHGQRLCQSIIRCWSGQSHGGVVQGIGPALFEARRKFYSDDESDLAAAGSRPAAVAA